MTHIVPIRALEDNYIWLMLSKNQRACAVDPGEAQPLLQALRDHNVQLTEVLITHHHWDHTHGLPELLEHYPSLRVYGPAHSRIDAINCPISDDDTIELENFNIKLKAKSIPGHTLDHTAYYNDTLLFSGDTLFGCGCGRVFEGTMRQMMDSLSKLKSLSDDIQLYCGHEYTLKNIEFARTLGENNPALDKRYEEVKAQSQRNAPTLPTTMGEEKATNPFLRCDDASLVQAIQVKQPDIKTDPLSIFTYLRQQKDAY